MKRIIATVICIALIATMAISGSVAYLTDEELDENVFQVGSVDIVQHEQQRDSEGNLEDYKDPRNRLHPMVETNQSGIATRVSHKFGKNDVIDLVNHDYYANYIDKIVTVENKGASDAYIRNIVAIPTGDADVDWLVVNWFDAGSGTNRHWAKDGDPVEDVSIGGRLYDLYVFKYSVPAGTSTIDELDPGDTTLPTLLGFGINKRVDYDENRHTYFYRADDGTTTDISFNPESLKILVATQAVQTAGFADYDHAFQQAFNGPITSSNHPWVDNSDAPKLTVNIGSSSSFDEIAVQVNNTEGGELKGSGAAYSTLTADPGDKITAEDLTISDLTIDSNFTQGQEYYALTISGDDTTIENVHVDLQNGDSTSNRYFYGLTLSGSNATVKNTTFLGGEQSALFFEDDSDTESSVTTIENCKFDSIGQTLTSDDGSTSIFIPSYGGGIRFQNANGTVKIDKTEINSIMGYALWLGSGRSVAKGNAVVSDSTFNATDINITLLKEISFKNTVIGNDWMNKLLVKGDMEITKEMVEEAFGTQYTKALAFTLKAQKATFENCTFTSGVNFTTSSSSSSTITFEDCYYGTGNDKVLITEENCDDYFTFSGNSTVNYTSSSNS